MERGYYISSWHVTDLPTSDFRLRRELVAACMTFLQDGHMAISLARVGNQGYHVVA
jgi:hypothetical protein